MPSDPELTKAGSNDIDELVSFATYYMRMHMFALDQLVFGCKVTRDGFSNKWTQLITSLYPSE